MKEQKGGLGHVWRKAKPWERLGVSQVELERIPFRKWKPEQR